MNEYIHTEFTNLITNSSDFRAFAENLDKYTTEEIITLYELNIEVNSCYGLLDKQA